MTVGILVMVLMGVAAEIAAVARPIGPFTGLTAVPRILSGMVQPAGGVVVHSIRERVEMLWPCFGVAGPLRRAGHERDR